MIFNKQIETMAVPDLRKLQSERFAKLVKYMYNRQDFYRTAWDQSAIDINTINSIEDIERFPFTTKSMLRDNYPFGLFARPASEMVRIHASSGSTGKPTLIGYSPNDIHIFTEVVSRSLCAAGVRPGMKIHNAYGYGLFTGGLGIHYGAENMGACVVPVSGGMTERQIDLLCDLKPEVLCCTPSYALTLADTMVQKGIDHRDIGLKFALLGAEPWTNTVREELRSMLNILPTNIYGLSEIIGPGVSQEDAEELNGNHIWEDHFYPEVIDPQTLEVLPHGTEGVLVLTTLTKTGMPLMRYITNDICSLFYDEASKRTHIKMSYVKGRSDDMLIIRGVNIFPSHIEALLQDFEAASGNYRLIISREQRLDQLLLELELKEIYYRSSTFTGSLSLESIPIVQETQVGIQRAIKQSAGINIEVKIRDYNTVPRSAGGKLNRVFDKR